MGDKRSSVASAINVAEFEKESRKRMNFSQASPDDPDPSLDRLRFLFRGRRLAEIFSSPVVGELPLRVVNLETNITVQVDLAAAARTGGTRTSPSGR